MQPISKQSPQSGLAVEYVRVRVYTEKLCEPLEIEDFIPQPVEDVSPARWNIAHTTWFFEEMILKRFVAGYRVFDEKFGFLFNSYYNSAGERTLRGKRGDLSRPTVARIFEYRHHVDSAMAELLSGHVADQLRDLVTLGLNHEQQHQELFLTDIKYTFSMNPLLPAYREGLVPEEDQEPAIEGEHEFEGGIYEIGHDGAGFCFDNELSRHKVLVDDFAIKRNLITNGEFLMFVQDGAYGDFRLWHSEGWDWVKQHSIASPLYWSNIDGEWFTFTLGGNRRMNMSAPVCHISFYEAAAYAEWRGMRLATEFEWEIASDRLDWGRRWEWTVSAYLPYPGFKKPGGAVGEYNGKFMINQMVLRGGSVATPAGHSRTTYRNFFHPHLRWQFTGIRLVKQRGSKF
ncbi:MAG: ergothioneine biosynthesis protein EgtB [Acidobacteriota bacterium]